MQRWISFQLQPGRRLATTWDVSYQAVHDFMIFATSLMVVLVYLGGESTTQLKKGCFGALLSDSKHEKTLPDLRFWTLLPQDSQNNKCFKAPRKKETKLQWSMALNAIPKREKGLVVFPTSKTHPKKWWPSVIPPRSIEGAESCSPQRKSASSLLGPYPPRNFVPLKLVDRKSVV